MGIEKLPSVWPDWAVLEEIGKGAFGKVYKAVHEEHSMKTYAAIKVISIPQSDDEVTSLISDGLDENASKTYFEGVVNDFINEIQVMETMKGTSNIVSIEDFKVLEREDKIGWDIFIRMELLTPFNKYLTEHRRMDEREVIKLGTDICTALELCSKKGIIHRDIKPENIFVSSFGDFKLGDFGIAKQLEKTTGAMSSKGTYNYMAPEVVVGKEYDHTVDIYSLGVVLYKMLNRRRLPFVDPYAKKITYQERKQANDRRLSGEQIPAPVNASPQLSEIVLAACAFEPAQRFSTATALKNALLSVNDFDQVPSKQPSKKSAATDPDATVSSRPASAAQSQGSGGTAKPKAENTVGTAKKTSSAASKSGATSAKQTPKKNPVVDPNGTVSVRRASSQQVRPRTGSAAGATSGISSNVSATARPVTATSSVTSPSTKMGEYVSKVKNFVGSLKPSNLKIDKKTKAKVISITVVVVVIGLAITFTTLFFTSPAYSVYSYMKSENYSDALSEYNAEVDGSFIQKTILNMMLKDQAEKVVDMFKNDKIEYNSAVEAINALDTMGFSGVKDKLTELTTINDSKNAFSKGDQYYEKGDYQSAIQEYSKITESDDNYKKAQEKLSELYPKYIEAVVKKAEEYISSKDYKGAVAYLNTAYDILPDGIDTAELDKLKSKSLESYKSEIMSDVTDLINRSKFVDALNLLDEAIAIDDNQDFQNTKTNTENKYVKSITSTVQKYLDEEDYISASRVVENALGILPSNSDLKTLKKKVDEETPTYLMDIAQPYESSDFTALTNGETVQMAGNTYTNGFVLEGDGYSIFNIGGNYSSLSFLIGHKDGTSMSDADIKIYCDGIMKSEYQISSEDLPQKKSIDITGVKQIKFTIKTRWDTGYGFCNVALK